MGNLVMSRKERRRLELLGRVARGELRLVQAAELLRVSYRQGQRIYARYREQGDAGLVHRLRGRPSNRRSAAEQRTRVLALYQAKYGDFGPTLAAEYLQREEGQAVSVTTLRRWLQATGLWQAQRRGPQHRRWRPRKDCLGELVQMDGSHHDWFEGRREKAVLMVLVDDATGQVWAQFFENESTVSSMSVFRSYVLRHGLPRALYVDRHSIYETTREATADEELCETGAATQFGRAMLELEVQLILAHSPQAKGRVERWNGVRQDRLVKALRLAGISDLAAANEFLAERFLPQLNAQFTVLPKSKHDLHRSAPQASRLDMVLSFHEQRVVQNDWTVLWRGRYLQLADSNRGLAVSRRSVLVCEQLDGTLRLRHPGLRLI